MFFARLIASVSTLKPYLDERRNQLAGIEAWFRVAETCARKLYGCEAVVSAREMDVRGNVKIWRNKGCSLTEASPAGRRARSVEMRGDQIFVNFPLVVK